MKRRAFSAALPGFCGLAAIALSVACSGSNGGGSSQSTEPSNSSGAGGSNSKGSGAGGSSTSKTAKGGATGKGGSTSTDRDKSEVGGSSSDGQLGGKGGGVTKTATSAKGGSTSKSGTATKGGSAEEVGGAGNSSGGSSSATKSTDPLNGDVTFSTPSQTFKDQIQTEMSTSIADAEIRYTVDGKLPTASSTLYSGTALTLKATTQVRAQAFVDGQPSGAVSSAIYVARTIDPSSDIPIVLVESYGEPKPCDKETYVEAAVMIWEPVDGVAKMSSLPTLATRAGYHVRGQSSMAFAQTPYKVELWDNRNKDVDLPVLGMPADSDWALIPPYYDRTLIRNPFVYTLGKDMGMEAPREAFAEVYINQTTHGISDTEYEGIYWVSELIKNNKVRTNLKQLKADDTDAAKLSGGYIMKFDEAAAEEPKIPCTGSDPVQSVFNFDMSTGGGTTTKETPASTTKCTMTYGGGGGFAPGGSGKGGTCWKDLEVVDPDDLNAQQKAWLTEYIQTFHDSLHASPIGDYASYIDVPSFIDYLLISELTRNVDAYVRSAYFFKDRDGKLKAGPLWDYNFALGGVGAQNPTPKQSTSGTATTDTGWQYGTGGRNVNNWYPKLTSDPEFMAQVKARYTELRKDLWSDAALKKRMDTLSAPLKQAVVHDYSRWPVSGVVLSSTGFTGGPTAPTWEGQLKVMSDFIVARVAWMDANMK